jgi:YHS domain-containing protein
MSIAAIALLPSLPAHASHGRLAESVRRKHFNLNRSKLVLAGYDPVSYHKSGPQKGKKGLAVRYRGVIYRFANHANKHTFLKTPSHYEPAFGGWCAWAMRDGGKTDIDPNNYLVIDDRLYVFYKGVWGDTRKEWVKLAKTKTNAGLIREADKGWHSFIG